jgi:hypothetical protein
MKPTIKASYKESNSENISEARYKSVMSDEYTRWVAIGFTVVIMLFLFYIYLKYIYNKAPLQNRNPEPKKSMEAVWSSPVESNMQGILYSTKETDIYFNTDITNSSIMFKNHIFEISNNSQGSFMDLAETNNTSITLNSNSSNYEAKSSGATLK